MVRPLWQGVGRLENEPRSCSDQGVLKKPWPPELPVITICVECNTGFSLDEQYAVSFLSSVISRSLFDTRMFVNACALYRWAYKFRGRCSVSGTE
jgi:hypothetical protein